MMNNLEATKVISVTKGSEEAYVALAISEQYVKVYYDDGTTVQEEKSITKVEVQNEEYSLNEVESNQTDGVLGEGEKIMVRKGTRKIPLIIVKIISYKMEKIQKRKMREELKC